MPSPRPVRSKRSRPLELFREGYAEATELQHRARRLIVEGWASAHPRALELLDSPVRDQVEALLDRRPLFFEIAEDGETGLLRDFASCGRSPRHASRWRWPKTSGDCSSSASGSTSQRVLGAPETPAAGPPRFSAIFGTVLAWHATRGEVRGDPLPDDVAADFLRTVASRRTAAPDAPARALEGLIAASTNDLSWGRGRPRSCGRSAGSASRGWPRSARSWTPAPRSSPPC